MKHNRNIRIGVLYNVIDEKKAHGRLETISELATEHSAVQTAEALKNRGFRADLLPLRDNVYGMIAGLHRGHYHAVVNLCESFNEHSTLEAQVAGLLELLNIPFTGNPSGVLSLCQNKFQTKQQLKAVGLPVPDGWLLNGKTDPPRAFRFPLIVKPNTEDASVGIYSQSVVRNRADLRTQIAASWALYRQPALVEQYIDGREFSVAVIEHPKPVALPVSEIEFHNFPPKTPRIVGYEAKWQRTHELYHNTIPRCPASIPRNLAVKLQALAFQAFQVMNLRGYARVDFRMGWNRSIFILEVNPNPDVSNDAGLSRALSAAGISYDAFWERQVQLALSQHKGRI